MSFESIVEVLNGVLAGVDLFEGDYPLALAEKGQALLILEVPKARTLEPKPAPELAQALAGKSQRVLQCEAEECKTSKEPIYKRPYIPISMLPFISFTSIRWYKYALV